MRDRLARFLRFFLLAPRDVDPLSWFTGPYVPLVAATLITIYGAIFSLVTWEQSPLPAMQLLSIALLVLGCVLVQVLTRLRNRFDWQLGLVTLVPGAASLLVAALAYPTGLPIEHWAPPMCLALMLASLAPYLAPWRILVYGFLMLLAVVPFAFVLVVPRDTGWDPVSTLLLIVSPIAGQTVGVTVFSVLITMQLLPMVENRSVAVVSEHLAPSLENEDAELAMLARSTARALPFLRTIIERGTVEPVDRAVAGEIARYLRDDLVSRSDLVWLGLPAGDTRVVVIDPERLADTLRHPQRAAIRDLVQVLLADPATDAKSILLELRSQPDGSTAVAMTLDTRLPEGRRVRHLAPYYFNLRGEVRDMRFGRDGLSFRVSPDRRRDGRGDRDLSD